MDQAGSLLRVLRHERVILATAIAIIAALAWVYLLLGSGTGMSTAAMTSWRFPPLGTEGGMAGPWTPSYAALMLVMWWTMMVAMMLPSAAPFVLLHARVRARAEPRRDGQGDLGNSTIFLAGYLLIWLGFSVLATAAQWSLEASGLLDGRFMSSRSNWLSGGLLIAAGLYQLSPIKAACLMHCRSPVAYLARHWRNGTAGALSMGLVHGTYCLGCCWLLMALLFVGGAMNLFWIAGLSILVLIEKLIPGGAFFGRATGIMLAAAGIVVLIGR